VGTRGEGEFEGETSMELGVFSKCLEWREHVITGVNERVGGRDKAKSRGGNESCKYKKA
jgi:hypothetical protein